MRFSVLLLAVCVAGYPAAEQDDDLYAVPEGFLIGAGLSAVQTEGAWNIDGKGESTMDRRMHDMPQLWPENVDIAADHYHRFKEDLALAKQMKLKSHRFSIAWERVLPNGDSKNPNPQGVQFYHDYIAEVRKNGMEPIATMFFFAYPQAVQDETNGWGNATMNDKFVEFATFLFDEYGKEVKYWVTFNEPNMFCSYFRTNSGDAGDVYSCIHNMLLSHQRAYHIYKDNYYDKYRGQVGFSAVMFLGTPNSTQYLDVMAAEAFNMLYSGTTLYVLTYGDYPPQVRELVDSRSKAQGLPTSRLPYFTEEEKKLLKGTSDFFGVNVYTRFTVTYTDPTNASSSNSLLGPMLDDIPFVQLDSDVDFSKIDPYIMELTLQWTWNNFHTPILITENGYGDSTGMGIHDNERAVYISANLRSLLRTAKLYGVKVIGYCAWSLIDAFEWSAGYKRPFGLIHIDYYETKTLARTLKDSSKLFIEIANSGRVPEVLPTPTTLAPSQTTPEVLPTPTTLAPSQTTQSSSSTTPSGTGRISTLNAPVLMALALVASFPLSRA